MAISISAAVKLNRIFERNIFERLDGNNVGSIRLTFVNLKRLVTDRHSLTAFEDVAVIVNHFFPRASVNHCLIAFKTHSLSAYTT